MADLSFLSGLHLDLHLIWAQDLDGAIGDGKTLPWRIPAELGHFKKTTIGCPVIMGRRTWESFPSALPGRANIVLTSTPQRIEGALAFSNLYEACHEAATHGSVAWIIGGSSLYHDTISVAKRLVVTTVDLHTHAPIHAPTIDRTIWHIDHAASDATWRKPSGDARWRVTTWEPRSDR